MDTRKPLTTRRNVLVSLAALALLLTGYAIGVVAPPTSASPPAVSTPAATTFSAGYSFGAAASRSQVDSNGGSMMFCAGSDPSPAASTDATVGPYITGSAWYLGCYRATAIK